MAHIAFVGVAASGADRGDHELNGDGTPT